MAPRVKLFMEKSDSYRQKQKQVEDKYTKEIVRDYQERQMQEANKSRREQLLRLNSISRDWIAELDNGPQKGYNYKRTQHVEPLSLRDPKITNLTSNSKNTLAAIKILYPDNSPNEDPSFEVLEPESGMIVTDNENISTISNSNKPLIQPNSKPKVVQPKSARINRKKVRTIIPPHDEQNLQLFKRKTSTVSTQTEFYNQNYDELSESANLVNEIEGTAKYFDRKEYIYTSELDQKGNSRNDDKNKCINKKVENMNQNEININGRKDHSNVIISNLNVKSKNAETLDKNNSYENNENPHLDQIKDESKFDQSDDEIKSEKSASQDKSNGNDAKNQSGINTSEIEPKEYIDESKSFRKYEKSQSTKSTDESEQNNSSEENESDKNADKSKPDESTDNSKSDGDSGKSVNDSISINEKIIDLNKGDFSSVFKSDFESAMISEDDENQADITNHSK